METVAESQSRHVTIPNIAQQTQAAIEGHLAQGEDDVYLWHQHPLTGQEAAAGSYLLSHGPVARGRTASDRRDKDIGQPQPIVAVLGSGLIGESRPV